MRYSSGGQPISTDSIGEPATRIESGSWRHATRFDAGTTNVTALVEQRSSMPQDTGQWEWSLFGCQFEPALTRFALRRSVAAVTASLAIC